MTSLTIISFFFAILFFYIIYLYSDSLILRLTETEGLCLSLATPMIAEQVVFWANIQKKMKKDGVKYKIFLLAKGKKKGRKTTSCENDVVN